MPAAIKTMAYANETPWHGLGTMVPPTATVKEIQKAAGLQWSVSMQPLFFRDPDGKPITVRQRALVRDDTQEVLDVCGPGYQPFQNTEILEFFHQYVEAGSMHMETAGHLHTGNIIWALAKLKQGFTLGTKDRVEGYLLLSNPHKYGKGFTAKFTTVRVVCWNTLCTALRQTGTPAVTYAHIQPFTDELRDRIRTRLGLTKQLMTAARTQTEALADTKVTAKMVDQFLAAVFNLDVKAAKEDGYPRPVQRVLTLFEGEGMGSELATAKGTAWGLVNAVTQYVDWEQGRAQDRRMASAWFGSGATLKTRALAAALELAK